MAEYEFTITFRGGLTPTRMEALFEAGCDDMTFAGGEAGPAYAYVNREAGSFTEAALSAIRDIEKVSGLVVDAIDGDELVSASEIASRLGRTRESVRLLISGERGPGGFPSPRLRLRDRTRIWLWSDVAVWAGEHLERDIEAGHASEAATVNAALALRRGEATLPAKQRRALQELVAV